LLKTDPRYLCGQNYICTMLTETKFKEIYARYESSGLPIRSFCQNEGINEAKFYYWKKRLQRFMSDRLGFIPVKMEERKVALPPTASPSYNPVFNLHSGVPDSQCSFEITYPNGTRLKLTGTADCDLIKSLVLLNR